MNRILVLMFLTVLSISCSKSGGSSDCVDGCAGTVVAPVNEETSPGEVVGSTTGGTTGSSTTGGTTGSSTTGGTTGSSTTGGTSGSSTTGGTSGSSTTGGTSGSGLPTEAFTFDTNIKFLNTTSTQQAKFDDAIEMIKKVVASEEFRSKILGHTYKGKKTFFDNGGFTNAQIYQKILEASETLNPTKNNTMDMEVELYFARTSTVGYTYANSKRIWVNTKYFNTNSVAAVAANLFHEWLHKIGFVHAMSYSTSRDYSVPYAIGKMVQTIGPKL